MDPDNKLDCGQFALNNPNNFSLNSFAAFESKLTPFHV
jgi:hypothetical protein